MKSGNTITSLSDLLINLKISSERPSIFSIRCNTEPHSQASVDSTKMSLR